MNNRKMVFVGISIFTILTLILGSVAYFIIFDENPWKRASDQITPDLELNPAQNITLIIEYANFSETQRFDNLSLQYGSAFDAINEVTTIAYQYYGSDVFVKSINGIENNENNSQLYWNYYINGDYPNIASNRYQLHDNDLVIWSYQ